MRTSAEELAKIRTFRVAAGLFDIGKSKVRTAKRELSSIEPFSMELPMTPDEIGARLFAPVGPLEADHDDRTIFHGCALAFGHALSRFLNPPMAAAFLRQEAGRIERLAVSPTTEVVQ